VVRATDLKDGRVPTILDGAMGTELGRRGVSLAGRSWSARANLTAPDVVVAIHSAYAAAGATVHTANTFRTTPWGFGRGWEEAAETAVALARRAVPAEHLVAASLAPLRDCYRPDRSPAAPRDELRAVARALAATGADLLLCETFPHVGEAWVAVEEAVATGLPVWVSFTAGPTADLLRPEEVREGARGAVERGAAAVLVNCIPSARIGEWLSAVAECGVPFGAYANVGDIEDTHTVWHVGEHDAASYGAHVDRWLAAGATLVGGCCGTGPAHVAEVKRRAEAAAR
jgi:S-methylmethionine-dependent homocysteine/selenocysteine methylase